jgi:hypothetical protein
MTTLTRIPKFGKGWTDHDLAAYNIQLVEQSLENFFNIQQLPLIPSALDAFSTTEDRSTATDDDTNKLIHYLSIAQIPRFPQALAVEVFIEKLLDKLGYASVRRLMTIRQTLPLRICGSTCSAQTGISIFDEDQLLLMVVDNATGKQNYSEAPVIAAAIAAFQRNNRTRKDLHRPLLDEMTIPAITMCGTFPMFYRIKVTTPLNDAVQGGTFPATATIAYRHIPSVPRRFSYGMKPLDNRRVLLQYFEAFRQFV